MWAMMGSRYYIPAKCVGVYTHELVANWPHHITPLARGIHSNSP